MTQFVRASLLLALLALSLKPMHCDSFTRLPSRDMTDDRPFPLDSNEASKFDGPEIKGPYARPITASIRKSKRLRFKPVKSRVPQIEALEKENEVHNTVGGDYYYYTDNDYTYDQLDQGKGKENIPSFPFATLSKTSLQPDYRLQSGYYDSHHQLSQGPPSWRNFLKTFATCLPFGLVAAAIPLGFVNFYVFTSTVSLNPITVTTTVTTTTTELVGGGPVGPGRLTFRTNALPEGEQAINVQPKDLRQHYQIYFGCSSTSGNCSSLHLSPTPVMNENGSVSDLTFIQHHLTNWTSDDPKSKNEIQSKVGAKINLLPNSENAKGFLVPLEKPIHQEVVQSFAKTDTNANKPSQREV